MARSAEAPPAAGTSAPKVPHDGWAVSVTGLFSDWSYEMLLPVLPFFLAIDLHASALIFGLI